MAGWSIRLVIKESWGPSERFSPFTMVDIPLFSPPLHLLSIFHLQHAKLAIMFAKTIYTLLTVAWFLLGAVNALQTVTSPSGVDYNCPEIKTIEVAYAGSCKSPKLVAASMSRLSSFGKGHSMLIETALAVWVSVSPSVQPKVVYNVGTRSRALR
jgi:hypothetical protein